MPQAHILCILPPRAHGRGPRRFILSDQGFSVPDKKLDLAERDTPPQTPEEWRFIWRGSARGNKAGPIIDPVYTVGANWKVLAIAFVILMWVNSPRIKAAVAVLTGDL